MADNFYMIYRQRLDAEPVVFVFDHERVDWAEVLNRVSRHFFPGIEFEPDWKVDLRIGVTKDE